MAESLKLSISLMTSNRKDTIGKCLDSLSHLREMIPSELVIVDTGCDEEMLEIIRSYADRIVPFVWCNDFAAARNAGIQACSGNWFLFLDDDEWFEDTTAIEEFFLNGDCNRYGEASYIVRNYSNMEGTVYQDGFVKRIIRLDHRTKFVGRIHETLLPQYEEKIVLQSFVHHYGYAFPDRESSVRHSYRNIIPLREGVEEEPDNMHWRSQLVLEYLLVREYRSMYVLCEESLSLLEGQDDYASNVYRGCFYGGCVAALSRMQQDAEAVERCKAYLSDTRNSKQTQMYLHFWLTAACAKCQDAKGALQAADAYLELEREYDEAPESFWKDDMLVVRDAVDDYYRQQVRLCAELARQNAWREETEQEKGRRMNYDRLILLEQQLQQSPEDEEVCLELMELYYTLGEYGRQERLADRCLAYVADELRQLIIAYYVDAVFTECRYDKVLEALRQYGSDGGVSDVTLGLLFCEGCIAEHRLQHQGEAAVYGKAYLERFLKYHEIADDMPLVIGMAYRMNAYELVREALGV